MLYINLSYFPFYKCSKWNPSRSSALESAQGAPDFSPLLFLVEPPIILGDATGPTGGEHLEQPRERPRPHVQLQLYWRSQKNHHVMGAKVSKATSKYYQISWYSWQFMAIHGNSWFIINPHKPGRGRDTRCFFFPIPVIFIHFASWKHGKPGTDPWTHHESWHGEAWFPSPSICVIISCIFFLKHETHGIHGIHGPRFWHVLTKKTAQNDDFHATTPKQLAIWIRISEVIAPEDRRGSEWTWTTDANESFCWASDHADWV